MSEEKRLPRGRRMLLALITALVVSVAFVGMTMARNNYASWNWEFFACETGVAVIAATCGYLCGSMDERGVRWADGYLASDNGALRILLSNLVPAGFCAVLMTLALAVLNVAYVSTALFHEEPLGIPMGILMRFLADIPTCLVLCLAVRLAALGIVNRHARGLEAKETTRQ
ncbi:MAG: hypothetical protein QM302_00620 [Acidobacteriota bacterium]|nr:hypothetical protein [Acidobacteriota bacterium]